MGNIKPIGMSVRQRESNFELMRLLSQFIIVLYHLFFIFIGKADDNPLWQAIQMPLHIGVIVFVLLSGYFSINATSKKLLKLLAFFLVYTMPETIYTLSHPNSLFHAIHSLFLLSYSHFWFIKTYLFLFLVSPMLNLYWESSTVKWKWFMTIALGFVSVYMATTQGDKSMLTGKNLVNFMFLYYVGRLLAFYKDEWNKKSIYGYIILYLCLNIILVTVYLCFNGQLRKLVFALSYPYSSPILLINSILFFIIVGKIKFRSKVINYLAASSLAIYLIHGCRPFVIGKIGEITMYLHSSISNELLLIVACMVFTLVIILFAIVVDKMLTPLWKSVDKLGDRFYFTIGR